MFRIPCQNLENRQNLSIPFHNNENLKIYIITRQKNENNKNLIIPLENHENHEIHKFL